MEQMLRPIDRAATIPGVPLILNLQSGPEGFLNHAHGIRNPPAQVLCLHGTGVDSWFTAPLDSLARVWADAFLGRAAVWGIQMYGCSILPWILTESRTLQGQRGQIDQRDCRQGPCGISNRSA